MPSNINTRIKNTEEMYTEGTEVVLSKFYSTLIDWH